MKKFMPQIQLKLILFLVFTTLVSCKEQKSPTTKNQATFKQLRNGVKNDPIDSVRRFNLSTTGGRLIKTVLLVSFKEQEVGLSGLKSNEYQDNEGALFWYPSSGVRRFWMPDTYFNLDIIFLDDDLKIVDIDRNLAAHPGKQEPPPIQFSKTVTARHVLEIKSDTPLSRSIRAGDQLQLLPPLNLSQIESKTHQLL